MCSLCLAILWSTARLQFIQPTGWLDLLSDQWILQQLQSAAVWIILRTATTSQRCVIFVFIRTALNFSNICKRCAFIQWFFFFLPFVAGYNAATAAPQGYSQPVQGYGSSSYDSSTAAVAAAASTTSSNQTSYAGQTSYGAQSTYPGYGQQPASAAPPRYWVCSA